MARTVIKQPNGNYAVFSTVIDDFIMVNATKQEIIDADIEEARERINEKYDEMFKYFDKDEHAPVYLNHHMTWEEAMERVVDIHGGDAAEQSEAEALPK